MPKKFRFNANNSIPIPPSVGANIPSNGPGLGTTLYNDTAAFGKTYTGIVSIVIIIACVIGVIFGIFIMRQKPVYTKKTKLTVTSVKSESYYDASLSRYVQKTAVNGTIPECGSRILMVQGYDSTIIPVNGDQVEVYIKENGECGDAQFKSENNVMMGLIIIIQILLMREIRAQLTHMVYETNLFPRGTLLPM
jgi:hypothetical protein